MKLAVVEDEQSHSELLITYLKEWGQERGIFIQTKVFADAEQFLFVWEEYRDFDALFVDIQMGKMNGMEMARKIRETDEDIPIVFTTGIADYLEEGYEVEALYYCLKPLSREKLDRCMDKVLKRDAREHYVLVQAEEHTLKLSVERIVYVEARGHSCLVEYCTKMGEILQAEVTDTLTELERQLENYGFIRSHRSYLCRVGGIHHIGKTEILFDNGSRIPVSRRMYEKVNQAFIRHFRRMQDVDTKEVRRL